MTNLDTIVVVGTSLAGLRAIEALRREGFPGRIVAIGAETHPPYDRPPLSKQFLKGDWNEERLALRRDGLDDLEVDWRLGESAASLDVASSCVVLEGGERVAYDGLLIATGANARGLPFAAGLAGIHRLRTLDDSRALRDELAASPRVLVVGAGFIGMEVAASCRERGLEVTVVEPMETPLLRGLGPELGRWVGERHAAHGVGIHCGVGVEGFEGNGRVERVRLSDGSTPEADVVVVGVGAAPATEWLEDSGLEIDDGVVCDGSGMTRVGNVLAAGDVARWGERRLEHWTSATDQAVHAAGRLLRGEEVRPLEHVPYVWTDQFELRLQIAGHVLPADETHVCHGNLEGERFLVLFGRGGRLSGAVANKRPRQLIAVRKLLAAGSSFADAIAANPD
jgi:3-phenylpropionate/trans-cinnamate dioxygenase ferredoxin reductase subunit